MGKGLKESTVMAWCMIGAVGLATLAYLMLIEPAKQIYEPSQTVVTEAWNVYDTDGKLVYRVEKAREIERKINKGAK